jgi:glycerol uptake facilitator-like aquaporin
VVSTEVLLGYSISGTSLNPAKNFGPALVLNLWHNQWIYFTAPIIGALLAAIAFQNIWIYGTYDWKAISHS